MKNEVSAQELCKCLCGGRVFVPSDPEDEGFVIHSMPTCKEYDEMDPLSFVTWLRLTLVGSTKDDQ